MQLDVIHVHTEFGVGMFGRIVAKYLNIPVVTTYHTMYEDYTHYVNRFEIDEVDKVTKKVVSTFSRSISDSAQAVIHQVKNEGNAVEVRGEDTDLCHTDRTEF